MYVCMYVCLYVCTYVSSGKVVIIGSVGVTEPVSCASVSVVCCR